MESQLVVRRGMDSSARCSARRQPTPGVVVREAVLDKRWRSGGGGIRHGLSSDLPRLERLQQLVHRSLEQVIHVAVVPGVSVVRVWHFRKLVEVGQ